MPKILVVEDNEENRDSPSRRLQRRRFGQLCQRLLRQRRDNFQHATGLGTGTFAGGSDTTITMTPNNDTLVEGDERAIIFVNTGRGYGVGASPAIGTITDNDTATISFVGGTSNAPEETTPHTIGVTPVTAGNGVTGAGSLQKRLHRQCLRSRHGNGDHRRNGLHLQLAEHHLLRRRHQRIRPAACAWM
jgi:hypothetical protein